MDLSAGQIVYAKNGRDAGKPFIIVAAADGYVWLADGKRRKFARPKRKKSKHVRLTNRFADVLREKLENGQMINDSDIRKALVPYRGQDGSAFE